ncbi:nitroreductase family protein [Moorella sulfitireducens]|uniref:nitroreductase family protein n=1 Tax=Neomoorella sulfitireducens TaxID=2972948 RepID=UPI0021AD2AE2|nr:nitroreductase family protein [Moorella sulfitireducens]
MELYELIKRRRSIRKYETDPVPQEVITRILEIATWAPSGLNRQPWRFIVVIGDKKDELARAFREVAEAETMPAGQRSPRKEGLLRFVQILNEAPAIVVALSQTHEEPGLHKSFLESTAAAFSYLLLAATREGLGTCWMTGPLNEEQILRKILSIPDDMELVALTPLGYPDEDPAPKPRKPLEEVVTWLGD